MMPSSGPDPRDYQCMALTISECDGHLGGYTRRELENDLGWMFKPIKRNGHVDVFVMCGKCLAYYQGLWAFRQD